jgi:succinyl-CoA synthetase alpha subunit
MPVEATVLPNRYYDSVFLMRVARRLTGEPGISDAAVVMGTPKNLEVLAGAGYTGVGALGASPNDLVVALKADTREIARAVLESIDNWLRRDPVQAGKPTPRTLDQAFDSQPASNLAVISVPGEFAAAEAAKALRADLNVFIFSNNVPIEEEVSLKQLARGKGLLVMGPDCGTSIIGGAGIGFANAVRRGNIGVIGASGTGIQEVTTLVHHLGCGISHALGTGSRDLWDTVGGLSTLQAMDALESDPATSVIVLVSKPSGKATLSRINERIGRCSKPVVACFFGASSETSGHIQESPGMVTIVRNLDEAAYEAVRLAGGSILPRHDVDYSALVERERGLLKPGQRSVRGTFAGGTFCYQAQQVMGDAGLFTYSNEPVDEKMQLPDSHVSIGHTLVDMGADEFTLGRPHPMIDSDLRAQRLIAEAGDPEVAVLLLDFILGYGASPDPVGELAPAVHRAKALAKERGGHITVVASICGTPEDPQGLDGQTGLLEEAGAIVFPSSFRAARFAASIVAGRDRVAGKDRE